MSTFNISLEGRRAAGLPDVLAAVAARATSDSGAAACVALPFLPDGPQMAASMARVDEARALRVAGTPLPAPSFPNITSLLGRLQIEAPLEGPELLRVAEVLEALGINRRFETVCGRTAPKVAQALLELPDCAHLLRTLRVALAPDGTVRDEASPSLARARMRVRQLSQRIRSQMEGYLTDETMVPYLQDSYVSIRHDRYVLPINASFAAKVPGIIHNASQTGQTVFIEPTAITALGNALALAHNEEAEEVLRVLALLSQELTAVCPDLQRGLTLLTSLDVLAAMAHLAVDLELHTPTLLPPEGALHLPALRHPGLLLSGQRAVANALELVAPAQVLLISGPNGGGKTVVLTATALAVLMSRLGLPIATGPGARLPVYHGLFCTVGDAQNLAMGLSSFAAQLLSLKDITEQVRPGWLVLIDELCGDTDPTAGGAIGRAVLDHCANQHAHLVVTTHLSALKVLALTDRRFVNGRMGYDGPTLAPTYRLEWGVAGQSRALELARRLGLSEALLARAEGFMGPDSALGAALSHLESAQDALQAERAELEALRLQLRQELAAQERHHEARAEQQARAQTQHQQALRMLYQEAREGVAAELAAMRRQGHEEAAKRAARALADKAAQVPAATPDHAEGLPPVVHAHQLQAGMWVHVRSMGQQAQVTEVSPTYVTVRMGNLRTRVPLSGVSVRRPDGGKSSPEAPPRAARRAQAGASTHSLVAPGPVAQAPARCDVRGLRLDEAERLVVRTLDLCLSEGQRALLVVHGHGTGQLKEGLHDLLRSSPYVASFRLAESHEGGHGVTLIELDG